MFGKGRLASFITSRNPTAHTEVVNPHVPGPVGVGKRHLLTPPSVVGGSFVSDPMAGINEFSTLPLEGRVYGKIENPGQRYDTATSIRKRGITSYRRTQNG